MFINEIKMNNFMRFKGNVTVKLNKGITVIFGDNGAGKTSIIDAIFFALYGKTYRTNGTSASGFLSIKDLINRQEKSAEVELLFTIDGKKYKIIRKISKSGSSLSYLNEGNEQIAEGKKVEEMISSKIVGFDYNSLKNSIVIMQKEISSYLTMSGAERKLSLINLFKLNEYNDYLSKAKEYAKGLKLKEDEEEFKINQYNKDLEKENYYLSQEKESEKNTEDFSKRQKELEERLKELETKLSNILNTINESEMSIRLFNQQISSNKNKLIDLNKSFNTIGNAQTCPLCLQEISNPQSLNKHYTEEINKVEKEIADLTEKANKENKIKNTNLEEKYNMESEINKNEPAKINPIEMVSNYALIETKINVENITSEEDIENSVDYYTKNMELNNNILKIIFTNATDVFYKEYDAQKLSQNIKKRNVLGFKVEIKRKEDSLEKEFNKIDLLSKDLIKTNTAELFDYFNEKGEDEKNISQLMDINSRILSGA